MSYPTVAGQAVEGSPYREAQMCLGTRFAGAYYLFFLSGTSTPTNVYTNGTLTTPFPSVGRVTADAFGRFAPIYLDPSIIYRVQFFNSSNVQQWQVDPYTSQLATVGTSSLSAFGVQIAPTGEVTIPSPNTGGSGVSLTLNSGALGTAALQVTGTLPGNSAIIVNSSATTGAQTATFTATNKPGTATSSPAGWLPITCDGVQYYTPIWHGNNFTPYVANPTALGEIIVGSSVTFGGGGLTTVVNGTATPSNWFSPATVGIGAGYYISITKTGGLSGVAFSAAQGSFTNITAGGLTITSNAQATITGTYQLSTSISGSPIVANGTITLSGNNGVQQPTYNGVTPINLAGNGTATLNGVASSNWFAPTTANVGAGFYILITQTGGTTGTTFTAATGTPANITNGGLSIGITGGSGSTTNATGTYVISSDSAGTVQLGSGTITLNSSFVQSSNWSGTTPLILVGDGTATLNGISTSSWYLPTTTNIGSSYYINITRTGGTGGVNFSAAQGSWTNITNSGLSIGLSGTAGNVGTVTASGTYQISSSPTGSPVLGSGTISLSLSGLTVTHTYLGATGSSTETVPTGSTSCTIQVLAGGGGGGSSGTTLTACGGGGGGGYCSRAIAVIGGNTLTYNSAGNGNGSNAGSNNAQAASASTVSGTVSGGTVAMTANGGGAGTNAVAGAGGTASGGTTNTSGSTGQFTTTPQGGASPAPLGGSPDSFNSGHPDAISNGAGGYGHPASQAQGGGDSVIQFTYS